MSENDRLRHLREAAYFEAKNFALPDNWHKERRRVSAVAIDNELTRDRDDAIALESLPNGGQRANICIADVGSFLVDKPSIRSYAEEMAETRYLRTGNIPMIPPGISEDALSLHPGELRPTLSVSVDVTPHGEIGNVQLSREALQGSALSYRRVAEITKGRGAIEYVRTIRNFEGFAKSLLAQRRERGAVAYYNPKKGYMTNEDGEMVRFKPGERGPGELIVQEFMILANSAIAEYMAAHNIPGLYRNHHLRQDARAKDVDRVLAGEELTPELLSSVYDAAFYSPVLDRHAGLNLEAYTHFTSPLRRYVDFVNHANLVAHLEGREYPYAHNDLVRIADHANVVRAERRALARGVREEEARLVAVRSVENALVRRGKRARLTRQVTQSRREEVRAKVPLDAESIKNSIVTDRLSNVDQAKLLFKELAIDEKTAEELRGMLVAKLKQTPGRMSMVINDARQANLLQFASEPEVTRLGEQLFTATIQLVDADGEIVTIESNQQRSKKAALEDAQLMVIARQSGIAVEAISTLPAARELDAYTLDDNEEPKNLLQEFVSVRTGTFPTYEVQRQDDTFVATVTAIIGGVEVTATGNGINKKNAERAAAVKLIAAHRITRAGVPVKRAPVARPEKKAKVKKETDNKNEPQLVLHGILSKAGLAIPAYEDRPLATDPTEPPCFESTVYFTLPNGERKSYSAEGSSKKAARKAAATLAIEMTFKNPNQESGDS